MPHRTATAGTPANTEVLKYHVTTVGHRQNVLMFTIKHGGLMEADIRYVTSAKGTRRKDIVLVVTETGGKKQYLLRNPQEGELDEIDSQQ